MCLLLKLVDLKSDQPEVPINQQHLMSPRVFKFSAIVIQKTFQINNLMQKRRGEGRERRRRGKREKRQDCKGKNLKKWRLITFLFITYIGLAKKFIWVFSDDTDKLLANPIILEFCPFKIYPLLDQTTISTFQFPQLRSTHWLLKPVCICSFEAS